MLFGVIVLAGLLFLGNYRTSGQFSDTVTGPKTPATATSTQHAPIYNPQPAPEDRVRPSVAPVPATTPAPTEDPGSDYVYVPSPDVDIDRPDICHRKWWC